VTESHPELRSSQNVLHFQEELGSTENRIAFARQFYNDAVLSYNTACQSFPGALVAGRLGFQPAQTFNLDASSVELRKSSCSRHTTARQRRISRNARARIRGVPGLGMVNWLATGDGDSRRPVELPGPGPKTAERD
jgi:hypothetical protein